MEQRTCCDCGQTKPLTDFRLRTDTGRRRPFCLDCDLARKRAHYQADPARHYAAGKRWREENIERARAYQRSYQATNTEKVRAWKAAYKQRQRDPEMLRRRTEREALLAAGFKACTHCQRVLPLSDFYRRGDRNHRHLLMSRCRFCVAEKQRTRYGKMPTNRVPADIPADRIRRSVVYARDDGICGICGLAVDPDDFHVDHVVPLARGGEHTYANVQVAHPACNLRKCARLPDELAAEARL